MQKIFIACNSQDEDIQENGLSCLREVAVQEYESVEFYFKTICETTANAANSPSNKVGAQAYEFWTTHAEVELERKTKGTVYKKYIDNCKNELMPLVFSGLLKINFEEDEDDEVWGHSLSAACCLKILAQLLKDDVMDPVVQFVAANIMQADWKNKYASLMALGSITDGPDKQ